MRLPFFYGWLIVVVTFVTMAIGVNARTAFSLFFPPIIDEFGWERGVTAGAFSFGFLISGAVSPLIGRLMDRAGPRAVMELGVALMAGGLLLAPLNLLLRKRPEDIGLEPDGDAAPSASSAKPISNIVDPAWAGTDWTLKRAIGTARFWWISLGYFCGLYIWYAVQVHQTKYLL